MLKIKPKVNYMIAAYGGSRRGTNEHYSKDKTYYLKNHLERLEKLKHNLDQITVIVAKDGECPKEFNEYINDLRKDDNYVIIERVSYGQSYGSWSKGFQEYREFDYHIFIEDDYVFTQDNFDAIMIEKFERNENCGYLCSLKYYNHAAISNGISSKEVLNKVWDKYNCLPHEYVYCLNNNPLIIERGIEKIKNKDTGQFLHNMMKKGMTFKEMARACNLNRIPLFENLTEWNYVNLEEELGKIGVRYVPKKTKKYSYSPQLNFSKSFVELKYEIYDISDEYCVPFWKYFKLIYYGDINLPELIVPIQCLEN